MYEGKSDQPSLRPNYKNKECAENGLDFGSKIAGEPRYYFSESPKKKLRLFSIQTLLRRCAEIDLKSYRQAKRQKFIRDNEKESFEFRKGVQNIHCSLLGEART